jgi:DNA-binding response OmpR family regulator
MKRVLVVDDEALLRSLIKRVLERAGLDVAEAQNGLQAYRLVLQTGAFDLVIADVVMPGLDGLEVIRQVRQQHPRTRIIAMSGWGRPDAAKDGLSAAAVCGADLFLEKPVGTRELLAHVSGLLRQVPA